MGKYNFLERVRFLKLILENRNFKKFSKRRFDIVVKYSEK